MSYIPPQPIEPCDLTEITNLIESNQLTLMDSIDDIKNDLNVVKQDVSTIKINCTITSPTQCTPPIKTCTPRVCRKLKTSKPKPIPCRGTNIVSWGGWDIVKRR
jgi:hypothetical protein